MKVFKILFLILILFIVGCKSTKNISSSSELNTKLSSKQIIKEHSKQEAKFNTLQSRVKVEYIQGNKSQAHTINLRIEKDKTIWISSFLNVIRVKITPEKVGYYNKLDNTYFEGDFSLISDLLGIELDFNKAQNLLLGEAIFDLKNESYVADTHEASYLLHPKNQSALLEIFFLLNPAHFKMDSQQLAQPLKRRMLQIDYENYQEVEKQVLPKHIKIIALEDNEETIINMEFKSIYLNRDLRFPFRIPSGFDEIVIR
jgi:outer membrane biogenesis lipoprotein LolB